LAARDGISIDQFIATAVAEKMAALMTEAYLEERAKRGSRAQYEAALAQVPDVEPEPHDRYHNREPVSMRSRTHALRGAVKVDLRF
jgi:hypothetical protein